LLSLVFNEILKIKTQVRQQDTNPPYGSGQLKLCVLPSPPPPFQETATSPSLIVCLAYSKLKINGGIQCRWRLKNSRLSTSIWSIIAGSNVPSIFGQYASYSVSNRRAIYKCRSLNAAADLAFITEDGAKMLKNQHILIIIDSTGG